LRPNSTTRFGGSPKNAVADWALRVMTMKSFLRQRAILARSVATSVSHPR